MLATLGPCCDTPGCELPYCCGVISGRLTNLSFTYVASIPMTSGTRYGEIDSVGVGVGPVNNQIEDPLDLVAIESSHLTVSFDEVACHHTVCPQEVGKVYRHDGTFTVSTPVQTTVVRAVIIIIRRTEIPNRILSHTKMWL